MQQVNHPSCAFLDWLRCVSPQRPRRLIRLLPPAKRTSALRSAGTGLSAGSALTATRAASPTARASSGADHLGVELPVGLAFHVAQAQALSLVLTLVLETYNSG